MAGLSRKAKKRLNHFADAIIGILTGYQIVGDRSHFCLQGEGEYVLNLLNGDLKFNGKETDKYPIFEYVLKWFDRETTNYKIQKSCFTHASVVVKVEEDKTTSVETGWIFTSRTESFGYATEISVNIKTEDHDYSKRAKGNIY